MWKEYERKVREILVENYPESEIEYDDSIFGLYSKVERQIDFAIRSNIAGKRILGVVDCKYYNKNIDVKAVESFIGMTQDVNASFGFMMTNKGYSNAAKNRVKYSNLKLDVLSLDKIGEIDISVDYFFNQNIKGLQLSKYEFYRRNNQNTGYFDKDKSNYKRRILVYKEGYANTEYQAFKKLLEGSVRSFRDFSQLDYVRLYIPIRTDSKDQNIQRINTCFSCRVTRYEIEQLLNVDVESLRDDIVNWRNDFLAKLTEETVTNFEKKHVELRPYSEYERL